MSKLEEILKYVSEHNEYYKEIIEKHRITNLIDINQYPLLSRDDMLNNIGKMISPQYIDDYIANRLKCVVTSGSTGKPLKSYISHDEYIKAMVPLWRLRRKYYNILPNSRVVKFLYSTIGFNNENKYYIKDNEMQVYIANLNCYGDYVEIARAISDFSPEWFYIQPSLLEKMMDIYENGDANKPEDLIYIESIGEILFENVRHRAKQVFNIPIANMYGAEEINTIAYECPFGKMHIISENVFVECVNSSGDISLEGKGNILVTDLTNYTTPKIRYLLGDIVTIKSDNTRCLCGCSSPTIENIFGRKNEYFILDNGNEMSSIALNGSIVEINNLFENPIVSYEFIFDRKNEVLLCKLEIKDSFIAWFDAIKNELELLIKSKYNVKLRVELGYEHHNTKKRYLCEESVYE